VDLIQTALERGIPVVSALGAGNKTDASLLRLCDIAKTEGCPLARVVRRELRRRGIEHLPVVYSPEKGLEPEQAEAPPPGRRSVPGSLVWVTAAAGMLLAQHVVLELTGNGKPASGS
jgi:tRNA A37 threonylcarbamoyladenosine dehydratase